MTPLAIFAADLHLADRTWSRFPGMCGDSYFAFKQVVEIAATYGVPLVLAGDIFDKAVMGAGPPIRFAEILKQSSGGVPVFAIEGNHELSEPYKWFCASPQVTALADVSPVTLPGSDVCMVGMNFQKAGRVRPTLDALVPLVAGRDMAKVVLVTHQHWAEFCPVGVPDASFADIPAFQLMVTGDYHVTQSWQGLNADGNSLQVFSPGSTCMQALNESPQKYVLLLSIAATGAIEMSTILLRSRPFVSLQITAVDQIAAVVADLNRITVDASLPIAVQTPLVLIECMCPLGELLHEVRRAGRHLHMEIVQRYAAAEAPVAAVTRESTAAGMLGALQRRAGSVEVYNDAAALWRSSDATVRATINEIVTRESSLAPN